VASIETASETAIARRTDLRYRYGDMETNKTAPEFTLSNENGNPVSLQQFRGNTIVLFFYPKAATSG
jgi:cytochrome oxidase Cu insertion factor (SCO1/SenC/PrrC family)